MNKELIRKEILHKRNNLTLREIEEKSNNIFERLTKTSEYKNAKTVMLYVSKGNEVKTANIIHDALKEKETVCVPKTDKERHTLHAIKITNPYIELYKGHFGIHEPLFEQKKVVPLHEVDIVVIPGIAFDLNGHRLGWGKGYYDRFLEKHKTIHKIGLAYEFQLLPGLPKDKHDVPVTMVVTEKRVLYFNFI
jgi:5-formyltetrahydrofolate cyclo-ligase